MDAQQVTQLINQGITDKLTSFSNLVVPAHIHNGSDAPFINFTNQLTIGASARSTTNPNEVLSVVGDVGITGNITATNLFSSTYTPTLTLVANLDAATATLCTYMRVGSMVTVAGRVNVDPTLTATDTQLGISLPIASNFTTVNQCAGTANSTTIAGQSAGILSDATNDRATMQFMSGDVTNQPMYFTFSYQII